MSHKITKQELYNWCIIPAAELENNPGLKTPFRLCTDSLNMGKIMARELVDEIKLANAEARVYRAIIPCGPACWYEPFAALINAENVSLKNVVVFHMDECLDWQGKELSRKHPYSFRGFMEERFYEPVRAELSVPEANRYWITPASVVRVAQAIVEAPIDITYGGWGQDGHIAYNQTRREAFSTITLEELADCTIRIQNNNLDTIIALAQRTFGAAYQFVPPMSITLGIRECLSAKKVRLFSDTGAWKQTALRVGLFSEPTVEYPITLLQNHPDALITATAATAAHPISLHPEWELF